MFTAERDGIKVLENFAAYSILMASQSYGWSMYFEHVFSYMLYGENGDSMYSPNLSPLNFVFETRDDFNRVVANLQSTLKSLHLPNNPGVPFFLHFFFLMNV